MKHQDSDKLIKSVLDDCVAEKDWYKNYMDGNAIRILADVDFVRKNVPSEASVIDIGGVPPLFLAGLKQKGYHRLSIIDPHPEPFIDFFAKKRIRVIKGDILSGDIAGHESLYDLVCLNEVVEHLAGNLIEALSRCTSLVRPGGFLLVTTPNLRSLWGMYALIQQSSGLASKPGHLVRDQYDRASAAYGYYGHVREYTPREIKLLMSSFGCKLINEYYQSNYIDFGRATRAIGFIEHFAPKWRLFAKFLFLKVGK